jgi:hypothetical protein
MQDDALERHARQHVGVDPFRRHQVELTALDGIAGRRAGVEPPRWRDTCDQDVDVAARTAVTPSNASEEHHPLGLEVAHEHRSGGRGLRCSLIAPRIRPRAATCEPEQVTFDVALGERHGNPGRHRSAAAAESPAAQTTRIHRPTDPYSQFVHLPTTALRGHGRGSGRSRTIAYFTDRTHRNPTFCTCPVGTTPPRTTRVLPIAGHWESSTGPSVQAVAP